MINSMEECSALLVSLRDLTESDLPVLFEHQNDPEACRMAAFLPRNPSDRGEVNPGLLSEASSLRVLCNGVNIELATGGIEVHITGMNNRVMTIASTSPLRGSSATTAPRLLWNESSATDWRSRSSVVWRL